MVSTAFHEESIKVADNFINSVLFVDDQIKWEQEADRHDLNALLLTKCFAQKGKTCSFFNYDNPDEENDIFNITLNCDVIVLDWKMVVKDDTPEEEEEEEDVDIQEGRGLYAIKLLKKIIESEIHSPKTIIVLTGENNGSDILRALSENFRDFQVNNKNLSLTNDQFFISIFFKPTLKSSKLAEEVTAKVIEYEDLPNIIVNEFATFSEGLISNVVLESVSTLKRNTNKLLQEYRKDLDQAYLTHRALCPIPEDSEELVLDSLVGSIESILSCQKVTDKCNIDIINHWIEKKSIRDQEIRVNNSKKNKVTINKEDWKEWLESGYKNILERKLAEKDKSLNEKQWNSYDKNGLLKDVEAIFSNECDTNYDFAILTHHKSNFYKNGYSPKLSLGTVLKSLDSDDYYLCIQQRCDSVRMEEGSPRRFLFLPLEKATDGKGVSIIFKEKDGSYLKLRVQNDSFALKTIHFSQTENGTVTAIDNSFVNIYGQRYEWLLDLKDSHAQKIANEFAAKLSRVGIDESEWLRRS